LEGLKGSESAHGYRAEISDGTGDRMTLHLGGDVNAVVALAESFWSDVLLSYRGRQIRETDVVFLRELELWVYPVSPHFRQHLLAQA